MRRSSDEPSEIELAVMRGHRGILALSKELSIEQIDLHRPDGCKRYEECLMYACIRNWRSWSCLFCDGEPVVEPQDEPW
jgi:hypothetical protein